MPCDHPITVQQCHDCKWTAQQVRHQTICYRPLRNVSNWWNCLAFLNLISPFLHWHSDKHRRNRAIRLLSTQSNDSKWCCFDGRFPLLKYPPYPATVYDVLPGGYAPSILSTLNNRFCFSAIGSHCNFPLLPTLSNIVLCGSTYHHMLDITCSQNTSCWLLSAPADGDRAATTPRIDSFIVPPIES